MYSEGVPKGFYNEPLKKKKKKSKSNKQKPGVLFNHLNVNSCVFIFSILFTELGSENVKSKNKINFPWSLKCFFFCMIL